MSALSDAAEDEFTAVVEDVEALADECDEGGAQFVADLLYSAELDVNYFPCSFKDSVGINVLVGSHGVSLLTCGYLSFLSMRSRSWLSGHFGSQLRSASWISGALEVLRSSPRAASC